MNTDTSSHPFGLDQTFASVQEYLVWLKQWKQIYGQLTTLIRRRKAFLKLGFNSKPHRYETYEKLNAAVKETKLHPFLESRKSSVPEDKPTYAYYYWVDLWALQDLATALLEERRKGKEWVKTQPWPIR